MLLHDKVVLKGHSGKEEEEYEEEELQLRYKGMSHLKNIYNYFHGPQCKVDILD